MKISNVSFNSKKIAFVDKKKSRSNAWKKKSGGKRKRRRRLKLGFVRKSKGKKKMRKKRSRHYQKVLKPMELQINNLLQVRCTTMRLLTTCQRSSLRMHSVQTTNCFTTSSSLS